MIRLVIFDMDGLMFDTEQITCRAFMEKGVEYGLPLDKEKFRALPGIAVYVAKPDDSLWQIGKKYYMPVARIKELNGLTTDMLKGGEKLLLVKER